VRGITYTRFAPGDSVAQGSNISFDATTLETWGALLNGARLVGFRKEDLLEPHRLRRQLVDHEIDMMFLPAALMKQLVAEAPATFASLRYFQSGGEQADFRTLRRIIEHGPPEHLINPYGPTETTVNATAYRCNDLRADETHVPIGFPLANTACYVLDQYLQPVPTGVVGELFIGGPGVSRGYLGQTGLTADRFVPDPFGETPGARMYRTGDLARYRPDGAIEFLGRADRQVKIRGFRVEPGEVEAAVLRSGQAREVSVQVRDDVGGDQVLVAYLVPALPELDVPALREFVRDQVPSYMVPGVFVPLPSLPLNANGKLDTAALRAITPAAADQATLVEPRTATEGRLDAVISDLLEVATPGVHGDFFRLGGDSLKAAALVARARTMFRVDIPLHAFFRNPTVATFAAEIDRLRAGAAGARAASPQPPAQPPMQSSAQRAVQPPAQSPAQPPVPPAAAPVSRAAEPQQVITSPGGAGDTGQSTVERLVAIWREVLDSPQLGPQDDFFAMGGHSLKVTRVASRVRAVFGVNVPLRLLFANPTVASFAPAVDELRRAGGSSEVGPAAEGTAGRSGSPGGSSDDDPATGLESLLHEVEGLFDDRPGDPSGPGA